MQNPNEKQIRFIDSDYNNLFILPDGGTVYLTYADGEKAEKKCEYIDQTHFYMGGHAWHICEFAERMEQNKIKYAPFEMPSDMPYRCYAVSRVSGELVILKYGSEGYFKCNANTRNKNLNLEIAQKVNEAFGITKAQAEAMYAGSLFGFNTPIAKPENYMEDGTLKQNLPFHNNSFAKKIRELYPVGSKIVLDELNDTLREKDFPRDISGIVQNIDDQGQISCIFENGSRFNLIPGTDKFHIDTANEAELPTAEDTELDENAEL